MKHGKIFFCGLLALVFLFGLSSSASGGEADLFQKIGAKQMKVKKTAPGFCLKDLEGKKVELKDFRGKVVFLNFWATWCGPCKEEMPSMESLWQWFKKKDFALLSVSVDYAGVKPVKEYITKQRYTFQVLVDPECQTLDIYEVKAIPTTLIIDRKGQIVAMAIGPKDWKSQEVKSLVDLLLKK